MRPTNNPSQSDLRTCVENLRWETSQLTQIGLCENCFRYPTKDNCNSRQLRGGQSKTKRGDQIIIDEPTFTDGGFQILGHIGGGHQNPNNFLPQSESVAGTIGPLSQNRLSTRELPV